MKREKYKMEDFNLLKRYDKNDMHSIIYAFADQLTAAREIGLNAKLFKPLAQPQNIIILGMGGSAIGGDMLRSYSLAIKGAEHLKIFINRTYDIPGFVDDTFHVIASSYSGGTEETLSAFEQASKRTQNLLSICSGGKLKEISAALGVPYVNIPGGIQPRCALGYSFVVLLSILMKSGAYRKNAIGETNKALDESIDLVRNKANIYNTIDDKNPAIELAKKIFGKIPVIYSSSDRMDTINLRWRGQFQENAKHLAFGSLLPEMNHNEINGWTLPEDLQKDFIIIFLEDRDDHPRVSLRFDALESVLKKQGKEVIRLSFAGETLLARMFDAIYLADWTSYYLALMNKQDPTAIPVITQLKNILSEK